ncbi:MAG: hypothetical protein QM820_08635 [Minicystis sp.]
MVATVGAVSLAAPRRMRILLPLAEERGVGVDGERMLLHEGGRLRQREREVAERLGQLAGGGRLILARAIAHAAPREEQLHGVLAPQLAQVQLGDAHPARVARGHEHLPERAGHEVRLDVARIAHAVEDDQPAGAAREPVLRGIDGGALIGAPGQPQRGGEVGEVGGERGRLLGAEPPDHVVLGGVGARVAERELRLADAAEAVDGDDRRPRRPRVEELAQLVQLVAPAREIRGRREGHVADAGERLRLVWAHPSGALGG